MCVENRCVKCILGMTDSRTLILIPSKESESLLGTERERERVVMFENSLLEMEMEEDYSFADVKQIEPHQQIGC